jgi:hypothetical protein
MRAMRKPKTVTIPETLSRLSRFCFRFLPKTTSSVLLAVMCLPAAGTAAEAPGGHKAVKPYALIYGTVWGPDNRPLYGVPITIRRASGKKAHWQVYSDHSGEFAQRVPAGRADYAISADVKGLKYSGGKHLRQDQDVTVHIENDERADIGLHLIQ